MSIEFNRVSYKVKVELAIELTRNVRKKIDIISKSNSNRLIFPFSLSHYIGKSSFSISIYMEEVFQQIDFLPFYMEREMRCLPFLLGIVEKLLGIEKKIKGKGR